MPHCSSTAPPSAYRLVEQRLAQIVGSVVGKVEFLVGNAPSKFLHTRQAHTHSQQHSVSNTHTAIHRATPTHTASQRSHAASVKAINCEPPLSLSQSLPAAQLMSQLPSASRHSVNNRSYYLSLLFHFNFISFLCLACTSPFPFASPSLPPPFFPCCHFASAHSICFATVLSLALSLLLSLFL